MQFRRTGTKRVSRTARTSVSFSRDDLAALAQLVQAGQVLLKLEARPTVVARLKAAMTRVKLPIPQGM